MVMHEWCQFCGGICSSCRHFLASLKSVICANSDSLSICYSHFLIDLLRDYLDRFILTCLKHASKEAHVHDHDVMLFSGSKHLGVRYENSE